MKSYWKVLRGTAAVVLAYLASVNAWWHYRAAYYLGPVSLFDGALRHLEWLGKAAGFMWLPGWVTVELFRGDRVATPITDVLIPILSAVYWGGMGIFILTSVDQVRSSGSWRKLSKIQRSEFVVAIGFLALFAGCFVCEIFPDGKYQSLGMILTLSVYGLSLSTLALAVLVALFCLLYRVVRSVGGDAAPSRQ